MYFRKEECSCINCNTKFMLPPSRIKNGRGKFCSKKCFVEKMPEMRKGRKGVPLYGEQNPNWRGKRAKKECPICHIAFTSANQTCSSKCGHKLRSGIISGENNPFARAHPKEIKKCIFCKSAFKSEGSKGAGKHFCSDKCRVKGLRKSPRQLWINKQLIDQGFKVEMEKSWPWLHRPNKFQRMRVDLWLPDFNTAIEYDGEHHFNLAFGNTEEKLNNIKDCDHWKNKLLSENGIKLIRTSGWPIDINNLIDQIKT